MAMVDERILPESDFLVAERQLERIKQAAAKAQTILRKRKPIVPPPAPGARWLGVNVDLVGPGTNIWPFVDFFKRGGGSFGSGTSGNPDPWYSVLASDPNQNHPSPLSLDANGWPTSLLADQVAEIRIANGNIIPNGDYVMLYEGEGNGPISGWFHLAGAFDAELTNVVVAPGRIMFTHKYVGTTNQSIIFFRILDTKPGDHIRNVRLALVQDEAKIASQTGLPQWRQDFLDLLAPFKTLRFLNWTATNLEIGSPEHYDGPWSDRITPGYAAYTVWKRGWCPYEAIVDLCNRRKADPWLPLPIKQSDAWYTGLATLLRDTVDPALVINIEEGNEVWNPTFMAYHYANERGIAEGLGPPDGFEAGRRWYAKRSVEVFNIFKSVFGPAGRGRLKFVLSTQQYRPHIDEWILGHVVGGQPAGQQADLLGISFYHGRFPAVAEFPGPPDNPCQTKTLTRDQILATPIPTMIDRLIEDLDCEAKAYIVPVPGHLLTTLNGGHAHYKEVHAPNLKFTVYEGGQGLYEDGTGTPDLHEYWMALNRHPDIARFYDAIVDRFRTWLTPDQGSKFCHFSFIAPYVSGIAGYWGILERQDQPLNTAYKYQALQKHA
jgi:hypothetical protein